MVTFTGPGYEVTVIRGKHDLDPVNDNVDVHVRFTDGSHFYATFFTLENIRLLFEKNRETGECAGGLYFWASDMIVVRSLTLDTIAETVAGLIAEEEFEEAFTRDTDAVEYAAFMATHGFKPDLTPLTTGGEFEPGTDDA